LPEAGERIDAAIAYLRSRNIARIALVSHSMGATMTNSYLAQRKAAPVDAWIPIGMFGAFAARPHEAVLDVIADNDLTEVLAAASRRVAYLRKDGCSKQVTIPGADHYFDSRQDELATTIATFLERVFERRCASPEHPTAGMDPRATPARENYLTVAVERG